VTTRLRVTRSWLGPLFLAGGLLLVVGAGAIASWETGTVGSFWRGLWWTLSLMTTVGFLGDPPETGAGAALSVVLMLFGLVLLASVSAALASLFVKNDAQPFEVREGRADQEILTELRRLTERVASLESRLADPGQPAAGRPAPGDPSLPGQPSAP
jgi:voltage-gated potassium channel